MLSCDALQAAASSDKTLQGVIAGADPQSVQYAAYLFSADIETRLRDAGKTEEAKRVALCREFWEAHDRRGLAPAERRRRLLAMRTWLLSGVDMKAWLRDGVPAYVKGIPIDTFEALISSAETVVALQAFTRACGKKQCEKY